MNEAVTIDPQPQQTTEIDREVSPETERVWVEWWEPIVCPDGELDLDQVKRELHDLAVLLDSVPLVYCHITNGKASKPFTSPHVINALHDDAVTELVNEAVAEERQSHPDYSVPQIEQAVTARLVRLVDEREWNPNVVEFELVQTAMQEVAFELLEGRV